MEREDQADGFDVAIETQPKTVLIKRHDAVIAVTERALLVTGDGPVPVYYVPLADVYVEQLVEIEGGTHQRTGLKTRLWSVTASGGGVEKGTWMFVQPTGTLAALDGYMGFEPDPFNITVG